MKNKTPIFILFLILLVLQTSTVFAFGISTEPEKPEKTSCSKEVNHPEKRSCCENDKKESDGCGGACDNLSCHCPGTVNIPVIFNDCEISNTKKFTLLVKDWSYIKHFPKAISLSIWQPPKIS